MLGVGRCSPSVFFLGGVHYDLTVLCVCNCFILANLSDLSKSVKDSVVHTGAPFMNHFITCVFFSFFIVIMRIINLFDNYVFGYCVCLSWGLVVVLQVCFWVHYDLTVLCVCACVLSTVSPIRTSYSACPKKEHST